MKLPNRRHGDPSSAIPFFAVHAFPAAASKIQWLGHAGNRIRKHAGEAIPSHASALDIQLNQATQAHPVYQQLNSQLRAAVSGQYQGGDKFLTEREISHQFSVSRATANKALASLVSEGVLEFRRGIGTFVRSDLNHYDVRSLVSFTEKAKAVGRKPSTKLLSFCKVKASQVDNLIGESLAATSDAELWKMKRVRLADGVPVILERRYVAASFCPRLTKSQASGSLYRAFTQTHSLCIAGADEIIRAVSLIAEDARCLGVRSRSPAIEVTSVGFLSDADESPLWWERTLYLGDQYEFHSRLGPISTATPARGQLRATPS